MLKAFYTSATGMRAQELLIDNTANNLANVNTTGFKRSHLEFADLLYDVSKLPGAPTSEGQTSPIGLQIGNGVRPVGTTILWTQGTLSQSGEQTHMAIEGEGFFKVIMPNGTFAYTRDGSFHIDANGLMVNGDGRPLEPNITIPQDAQRISISQTGEVEVVQNGIPSIIGTIQLVRFSNPSGLELMGGNLLRETLASGPEILGLAGQEGLGMIRQGFLEGSNVEVVAEMVNLITAQRAYEINSRAIRAGDEMLASTSQLLR
ncbi:MAG TPA: flagellar basal-body rod protein FlgG [Pirellulaceae bacterium]|nr:flagellar basal-body rod protein FlgG [Pirellulaceae bacterium]HMO90908.1 flagellar basal-body rod protein FlgG [Pirellulaceae bacterium]HMP68616.1 flagellar basal-body rod protein FlgG [Pirellulaceae bacterium]